MKEMEGERGERNEGASEPRVKGSKFGKNDEVSFKPVGSLSGSTIPVALYGHAFEAWQKKNVAFSVINCHPHKSVAVNPFRHAFEAWQKKMWPNL